MSKSQTDSTRVYTSVKPADYPAVLQAVTAGGYASVSALVYDALGGRVQALTGYKIAVVKRGNPTFGKGEKAK